MADRCHLGKVEKSPYLRNSLADRHEVWHGDTHPLDPFALQHFGILKIQDGGRRHFEKFKKTGCSF